MWPLSPLRMACRSGQLVFDGDPFRVDLLLDDHRLVALRGDRGLQRVDLADRGEEAVAQLAVLLAHALEELDAGRGVGETAVGQKLVEQAAVAELVYPGEVGAENRLLLAEIGLALVELQADLAELGLDGGELRLGLVPVFDDDLEPVVERGDLLLDLGGGPLQSGQAGDCPVAAAGLAAALPAPRAARQASSAPTSRAAAIGRRRA